MTGKSRQSTVSAATSGGGGALESDLAFLLKHAGHDVPADRMPGLLAGYADLKGMLALLRQPRTAAAEPANVYSLDTITRSP